MEKYYKEIFPFSDMYDFLKLSPYREIVFRYDNTVFHRYLSFKSLEEFKNTIICKKPSQMDVGSIYNQIPKKNTLMEVKQRELVFDVDITDYKRSCMCTKPDATTKLCEECFLIIKAAIGVLDFTLRFNFGFKNILFVFSGGKGVHCWVLDEEASLLTQRERMGIADFLKNGKEIKRQYNTKMRKTENLEVLPFELQDILDRFGVKIEHYIVLDREVTGNMKHLIKMPFSVHSNGKVSVPIDLKNIDDLKLKDFPTLAEVLENKEKIEKYLNFFKDFVTKK